MKFIGITGGVGAGKSTILAYLRENYRVRTLIADEVAHEIMEPGFDCYVRLQKEFATEKIWLHNGRFNKQRLAEIIFANEKKRERLNQIVHPAVKEYILKEVEKERRNGSVDYVVLEAALLIEDGYDQICDELWYVYVTEENRRQRLIEGRGYTEEKVAQIFAVQLSEREYRRHCQVIIDNNGSVAQVYLQLAQLLKDKGEKQMEKEVDQEEHTQQEKKYVFGLDIGTRNVVGTVGYKEDKEFIVVAQYSVEHETRAMLDGQIHDIGRVGRTISLVKEKLEDQIGQELDDVCIAAAGRVLKTVTTEVEFEFPEETVVTREHIHTLDLLGIDKAAQVLKEANDTKYKFYCVGYSVMKYYINDELFTNLESHKADKIAEKIIVTFLPEDVVDGLYMAVGFAGLTVANMTLEPIAAMDVAVPENFRMLNIALVDVGAGTSDICLTKDGSIIAYGMIPVAGDELTESLVQHYLVDFRMAEHIKLAASEDTEIEFEDIMSIKHTIQAEEVWKLTEPLVDRMTTDVAEKIKELNGDQSVSATFIVGGGGKIHGFSEKLAQKLDLPQERVALRGAEVLKEVTFLQDDIEKDPLLVTPVGICLNYYEQKNNFIMVHFNGERLKLYDNNKLTIVDAAIQAGFPNAQLFPRRGRELNILVNGRPRIIRGESGEAAVITLNDRPASINDPIEPNCFITIEPSTVGAEAHCTVGELDEYQSATITFEVNGKLITCPRYVEVNGVLEPPSYELKDGDSVMTRGFYTVSQLAEFMDVELDPDADIYVNNRIEDLDALVYENFSVNWTVITYRSTPQDIYLETKAEARMPKFDDDKAVSVKVVGGLVDADSLPVLPELENVPYAPAQISGAAEAKKIEQKNAAQNKLEQNKLEQLKLEQIESKKENQLESKTAEQIENQTEEKTQEQKLREAFAKLQEPTGLIPKTPRKVQADIGANANTNSPDTAHQKQVNQDAANLNTDNQSTQSLKNDHFNQESSSKQTSNETFSSEDINNEDINNEEKDFEFPLRFSLHSGQQQEVKATRMDQLDMAYASGNIQKPNHTPAYENMQQAGNAPVSENMQQSGQVPAYDNRYQSGQASAYDNRYQSDHMPAYENMQQPRQASASGNMQQPRQASASGYTQQLGHTSAYENMQQPGRASAPRNLQQSGQVPAYGNIQQPVNAPAPASMIKQQGKNTPAMPPQAEGQPFQVIVNGETLTLTNKNEYIFVDVFEFIDFDISQARGRMLATEVNGVSAQYTQTLQPGDRIDIYWKEG